MFKDRADHRGVQAETPVTSRRIKLTDSPAPAAAPRVLHVISPAAFGGLEQVVCQLAMGRGARGLPTEVPALLVEGSTAPPLVEILRQSGVRTTVLRSAHRAYLRAQRCIQAAASAFGADVVHTHGYLPDVLAYSPARKVGCGLVSTAHGFTGGGLKNRAYEWLQRRLWGNYDIVVTVSGPLLDRLVRSGVPASVAAWCPNAWSGTEPLDRASARERLRLPPSDRLLGWVGRLSGKKGPDVMVRAFGALASRKRGGDDRRRSGAGSADAACDHTWSLVAHHVAGTGCRSRALHGGVRCLRAQFPNGRNAHGALRSHGRARTDRSDRCGRLARRRLSTRSFPGEVRTGGRPRLRLQRLRGRWGPRVSARSRLEAQYAMARWRDRYESFYARAASPGWARSFTGDGSLSTELRTRSFCNMTSSWTGTMVVRWTLGNTPGFGEKYRHWRIQSRAGCSPRSTNHRNVSPDRSAD